MEIADIGQADLPALAGLYQQLLACEASLKKMEAVLEQVQDDPRHILLGAKIDGRLVGTLLGVACQMLFGQCRSFMVVEDLVVDRDHQRRGVGRALMEELEARSRQLDCSYVMLITDEERPEAHRFYESLGYKSEGYRAFKKKAVEL